MQPANITGTLFTCIPSNYQAKLMGNIAATPARSQASSLAAADDRCSCADLRCASCRVCTASESSMMHVTLSSTVWHSTLHIPSTCRLTTQVRLDSFAALVGLQVSTNYDFLRNSTKLGQLTGLQVHQDVPLQSVCATVHKHPIQLRGPRSGTQCGVQLIQLFAWYLQMGQ